MDNYADKNEYYFICLILCNLSSVKHIMIQSNNQILLTAGANKGGSSGQLPGGHREPAYQSPLLFMSTVGAFN